MNTLFPFDSKEDAQDIQRLFNSKHFTQERAYHEYEGEDSHIEAGQVMEQLDALGVPYHSPCFNLNYSSFVVGELDQFEPVRFDEPRIELDGSVVYGYSGGFPIMNPDYEWPDSLKRAGDAWVNDNDEVETN